MNILMVSFWDFQQQGMQVILRTPLYFAEHGHQVLFMVHSEQTSNPTRISALHPNIAVRRFDLPLGFMKGFGKANRVRQCILFAIYCLAGARNFYRDGRRPDVIYAAEADAVLIGAVLRRLYRVPLVTRFYGISDITAAFGVTGNRLRTAGLKHLLTRQALKVKGDMVIVTDDGCHGPEVVRVFNPAAENIRYWRNGIDRCEPTAEEVGDLRQALGIARNDFVLLTLSRLDPVKRVDRAIRCLQGLHKAGLGQAKLVVAGHGPDEVRLRQLVADLGVSHAVIFTGGIEHTMVYRYYALADVFLSLFDQTNLGNPMWEALNAGKCIVTLNNGETTSVIADGKNGVLVEVGHDGQELGERLSLVVKGLFDKPDLRLQLAREAKRFGQRNLWTWDQRLEAELDSITELAERARESRRK
jgi:glycosyltransferase involved in cell wall biosynthesis